MADRQDVGIKVSQTGYNALTAPDYNLTFSSSWPQLPIVAEYLTTIVPFNGGGAPYSYPNVTFTHNLGYAAFGVVYFKFTGSAATGIRRDPYNLTLGKKTAVYVTPGTTNTLTDTLTIFIRIYSLDLGSAVSYPYKLPPIISNPYDPDYGVKIVKENKDIESRDMRDFILHSRCQSPQIDSVNIGAVGTSIAYTNNTGYTNWVFGFGSFNSGATYRAARTDYHQSPPALFITGNIYTLAAATGMIPVILVLRDPLFVANQVEVVY